MIGGFGGLMYIFYFGASYVALSARRIFTFSSCANFFGQKPVFGRAYHIVALS